MKRQALTLLICTFIFQGCKHTFEKIDNTTPPIVKQDSSLETDQEVMIEISSKDSVSTIKDEDYREFAQQSLDHVYLDFDKNRVLERLGLGGLIENRLVSILLSSELRPGDKLVQSILETGDGTFDIYKLISQDNEIAFFYYEGNQITTIEIVHYGGTPDDMIGPGNTFEDLRATYDQPVAYGSEIEGRVFVFIDEVGFRLDTGWHIYEPIDVEDDTEILYIQF